MVQYHPLVALLGALAAGAAVDRYAAVPGFAWATVALAALPGWLVLWLRGRLHASGLVLLVAAYGMGGAWHHQSWELFESDNLGRCATEEPQPICLEAVALGEPRWIPAPPLNSAWALEREDRSQLAVRVTSVRDGRDWRAASGDAVLFSAGRLRGIRASDRLRLFAFLSKPESPGNPGELDLRDYERGERRLFRLTSDHSPCVVRIDPSGDFGARQLVDRLRTRGKQLLWEYISRERAGLAAAILLGAREQIDPERTEGFLATGTIHVLSVSGLHVGILAWGLWLAAGTGWLSRRMSLLLVVGFVAVYAQLTDARPPIMRASVLIVSLCLARYMGRQPLGYNSLAAAGIAVFALNPTHVFQAGTQLSFLAVATLIWIAPLLAARRTVDPLDRLLEKARSGPERFCRRCARVAWLAVLSSGAIWLVALPLVAYRFHVVSPIAILLNPLILAPVAISLYSGFGVLLLGGSCVPLGEFCGFLCDRSLWAIERSIDLAQHVPGNHFWTAGPGWWWVVGFYFGLGVLVASPVSLLPKRWLAAGLAAWVGAGLCAAERPPWRGVLPTHHPLECTFIDVGHGTSVLVEFPDGRTLLYDAGRLGPPGFASRPIEACLWSRGIAHLDAVILSHADADHYNALPQLLRRFSVGAILVSPRMFDSPDVEPLRSAIRGADVPVREIFAGDRLRLCRDVQVDVLHPPPEGVGGTDNANSLVVAVEFLGKRILLPGDLESPGMEMLLAEAPRHYDVVMAPHHGSLHSNPHGFAAWSTPRWTVISGGHGRDVEMVAAAYASRGGEALHTASCGAIRVAVDSHGVEVRSWRSDPWQ